MYGEHRGGSLIYVSNVSWRTNS